MLKIDFLQLLLTTFSMKKNSVAVEKYVLSVYSKHLQLPTVYPVTVSFFNFLK